MAISRAVLIADTTSTVGTGTYTLNGITDLGFRTLADAVANGDVADGNTVYYVVRDSNTKGDSAGNLAFERGSGVVGSSGTTITRSDADVTQSSDGGNRVSWGSGGSRTVFITLDPGSFALLADANTFTALQTFSAGLSSTTGAFSNNVTLDRAGAAAVLSVGSDRSTGAPGELRFVGHDAGGADQVYGQIYSSISDATAGSEDATLTFVVPLAGVLTEAFRATGAGLANPSGVAYALTGVLNAPSGTRLLIGNASVPTGWTIVAGLADRTIMLTSTIGEVDDTGGSWTTGLTASTTVDGTTLTEAQIPAHNHTPASGAGSFVSASISGATLDAPGAGSALRLDSTTATTGGGGSHTHTASTAINSTSYRPAYQKWAAIQKT